MCEISTFLQITMNWIKEVEIAIIKRTILRHRNQIQGGADFPEYETLDAKIASALRKIISGLHFRRASVEEQRGQKYDRFLRGRQMADMIV